MNLVRRADFRRAAACGFGALVAMTAAAAFGNVHAHSLQARLIAIVGAAVFLVLAILATRSTAGEISRVVGARAGPAAASMVRLLVTFICYLIVLLLALDLLDVPIQHLLLGGALTGVVFGIAAQQSLGNIFAGLVLLVARPFTIGDHIRIRSAPLGGLFEGTVTGMGLSYTRLDADEGPLNVPNASMLAAAVGPAREPEADTDTEVSESTEAATEKTGQPAGASR
jgi:small-conductance mechanosensitive channel